MRFCPPYVGVSLFDIVNRKGGQAHASAGPITCACVASDEWSPRATASQE